VTIIGEIAVLVLAGVAAGALAVLSGLGGGVVLVPALTLAAGLEIEAAIATSLIVVVANTISVSRIYVEVQRSQISVTGGMEFVAVISALIAASYNRRLDSSVLQELFGWMIVLICLIYSFNIYRSRASSSVAKLSGWGVNKIDTTQIRNRLAQFFLAGGAMFTGSAAGLLGIGGGIFLVPILQAAAKQDVRQATASAIYVMSASATVAAVILLPQASVFAAACCIIGLRCGSYLARRFLARASDRLLQTIIVLLMLAIAVRMLKP